MNDESDLKFPVESTCIRDPEERSEVLVAVDRDKRFVCGIVWHSARVITLYTGVGKVHSVPFAWFEGGVIAPNFDALDIIDHGKTVRLGLYEADADAILSEGFEVGER